MGIFRFPFDGTGTLMSRHSRRRVVRRSIMRRHRRLVAERFEPRAMLAIVQVSSTLPAGTAVGIGDTIPFEVVYDAPVEVLSSPVAYVNVIKPDGAQATAMYTGPSAGGLIQNFSYTVAPGDTVPQFDVVIGTFLVGGTINVAATGLPADRAVAAIDPTIADVNPGLRVDGVAPVAPTIVPVVYVNPTAWQPGAWATLHPDYFVISGIAGTGPLAAGEVLTVTVNGATYRATSTSPTTPGSFFVGPTGAWRISIRTVGANATTIPSSGVVDPWSTTNTATYNVVATLTDAAGNSSTDGTSAEVVIDMDPPALAGVNSTSTGGPDTLPGSYGVGSVLNFYVVYDEPIRVVGTPLLPINVTPTPTFAQFVGVVNQNEAHFQYTVLAGDGSPAAGANVTGTAINLNGGFIEDLAANPAPITPPTTPPANTVTGIAVNPVAPAAAPVAALMTPRGAPGGPGDGVVLSPSAVSPPDAPATNLTLPPVVAPDTSLPGAGIVGGPAITAPAAPTVALPADTTVARTTDQIAPTIQAITAPAATYKPGQTVTISVNFGEPVSLSAATPTLTLSTGGMATLVTPVAGEATTLEFAYVVVAGDSTTPLQVTAFNLNGATLADRAGNVPAGALVGAPVTLAGPVIVDANIWATSPLLVRSAIAPGPAVATRLASMRIVFNTPVRNFTLSSLRLYWNPDPAGTPSRLIMLRGASIRRVGTSGTTYTLVLPKAATSARGAYMLVINGTLSNIRSTLNPGESMTTPSTIHFRRV